MAVNHLGANSRGADMTESQDDKYLKHNDHVDLVADSVNQKSFIDIGFASGSGVYTLAAEDYTGNGVLHFRSDSSPSVDGAWTLEVPGTQRRFAVFNDTGFTMTVRSGGSPTGQTVQVGDGARADLHNDGENIEEMKRDVYDLGFFVGTWTFSAIMGSFVAVRPFTLKAGLPGSQAYAYTATSGGESDRIISIQRNESEIGFITFANGSNAGTFTFTQDRAFVAGDRLRLVNGDGPSPDETNTLADVSVSFMGESG